MGGIDFAVYITPELVNNNFNTKEVMDKKVIHRAASRGHANHGWLDSHHTFSFADYYDPERVHFGMLRVLNDDIVAPDTGFATHQHENMEIITIPLEGALEHRDNMGNISVVTKGEIQVMSAGTGITHSEYNANKDRLVKFLQIWVFPNKQGLEPRYSYTKLDEMKAHNGLMQIVSPDKDDEGAWINQNAWFYIGNFDKGFELDYQLKDKNNGVYVFVIKGEVSINGDSLRTKDGIGLWDIKDVNIKASTSSHVLVMEVPMR